MFKAGQKVKCIQEYPGWGLHNSKVYTVERNSQDGYLVCLEGIPNWFSTTRFQLVNEEELKSYKFIDNENVYAFDVDDTLVMWKEGFQQPSEGRIAITDPNDNTTVYLVPHERHIKLLKQCFGRGKFVVVWSAGGSAWARAVVEALELNHYVGLIITKPTACVDDLPISEVFPHRIYLNSKDSKHEPDEI